MSENTADKESWPTDLSPTTLFSWPCAPRAASLCPRVAGRGVPGVWYRGSGREGLYRYPTSTLPGPIFSIYLRLRPYPRPYEGYLRLNDEVSWDGSRIGSRMGPRMASDDPYPTLLRLVPRWPQMTHIPDLTGTMVQNRAYLTFY